MGGRTAVLFTDVEGSTALLRRAGDSWPALLGRHFDLLRAAIADAGGIVIGEEGDALFATFDDAAAAVHAAVAGQRALVAEPWPEDLEVVVRMGVHVGEVREHDGAHFGLVLHQTARVVAAGHGGQVVCSAAGAADAERTLPDDVALVHAGRFVVRDFDEPEHLFVVAARGLRRGTALRAMPASAVELPAPRSVLVGRDADADHLAKLLDAARLVTVVGPGGTGKTTLALHVSRSRVDDADGVRVALLAPVATADGVVPAIAAALGVADDGAGDLLDVVVDHLSARRLLVLIDNCEHVVDAVAPLVDRILDACPHTRVLATSRTPLGVRGEERLDLRALEVPPQGVTALEALAAVPAVTLFVERAQQARRGFRLDVGTAPAVVEIVRRLDGIPLAIELAAARVRSLTPAQLAARLDNALDILTGGPRTDNARQRTVRDLIDWSVDLLRPGDAALYRRLAVFRGGFDLAAAEAVAVTDDEDSASARALAVLDGIDRLVEASLLVADVNEGREDAGGTVRYRMLEVIRQHAEERLDAAGEADAARDRHLRWVLSVSSGLDSEQDTTRLEAMLRPDDANVTAALDWALNDLCAVAPQAPTAVLRWWLKTGRRSHGRGWCLASLSRWTDADPALAGRLLRTAAVAAGMMGRFTEARRDALEAAATAEQVAPEVAAGALLVAADAASRSDDPSEASTLVERALRGGLAEADRPWALLLRSWSLQRLGDPGEGDALEEAIAAATAVGDEHTRLVGLQSRANLLLRRGSLDDALAVAHDAVEGFRARHDADSVARVQTTVAAILILLDRLGEAIAAYSAAAKHALGAESWILVLIAAGGLAACLAGSGDDEGALAALHEAAGAAERADAAGPAALARADVAVLHALRGRIPQAQATLEAERRRLGADASAGELDLRLTIVQAVIDLIAGDRDRATSLLNQVLASGHDQWLQPTLAALALAWDAVDPLEAVCCSAAAARTRGPDAPDVLDVWAHQRSSAHRANRGDDANAAWVDGWTTPHDGLRALATGSLTRLAARG